MLLAEAAKLCSYSQEYLSLLARKGELKAKKINRKWHTRNEWLAEYITAHPADKKGNVKGEFNPNLVKYIKIKKHNLAKTPADVISLTKPKIKNLSTNFTRTFNELKHTKKISGIFHLSHL